MRKAELVLVLRADSTAQLCSGRPGSIMQSRQIMWLHLLLPLVPVAYACMAQKTDQNESSSCVVAAGMVHMARLSGHPLTQQVSLGSECGCCCCASGAGATAAPAAGGTATRNAAAAAAGDGASQQPCARLQISMLRQPAWARCPTLCLRLSLPALCCTDLALLDRGVVLAVCHVRGGGELGSHWHTSAKKLHKKRTFEDLLACAQHIKTAGYTSSSRLGLWGRSAGGLTLGAAINMQPDVAAAAVLDVPFLDVLGDMSDPELPLTVKERGEWGDPLASKVCGLGGRGVCGLGLRGQTWLSAAVNM